MELNSVTCSEWELSGFSRKYCKKRNNNNNSDQHHQHQYHHYRYYKNNKYCQEQLNNQINGGEGMGKAAFRGSRCVWVVPRDLANVNALKNHVRSLLLHKN